jgi:anti-sigma factor (TIGR02949 family)
MKEKPCVDHEYCIKVLNLIIDGEATDEETAFFNSHIKECLQCSEYYSLEQVIREAIKKKMEKKSAPEDFINDLRNKVKDSIRS